MKVPLVISMVMVVGLSLFFNLGISTKSSKKESNKYAMEELILIEFATRLEDLEFKFKDYHKSEK
jgi:hypothetical protein